MKKRPILTVTRMQVTKRRIIQFARQNNHLPTALSELLAMPGYDTKTFDAWRRPFDYRTDALGVITLVSLGADRLPGGDGDNRDIIGIFESRDGHENWQDETIEWRERPHGK
jgi:hypothetical protein